MQDGSVFAAALSVVAIWLLAKGVLAVVERARSGTARRAAARMVRSAEERAADERRRGEALAARIAVGPLPACPTGRATDKAAGRESAIPTVPHVSPQAPRTVET